MSMDSDEEITDKIIETYVFIAMIMPVLKLWGCISWSWWVCTALFWVPFVLVFLILTLYFLYIGFIWIRDELLSCK